MATKKSYNRFFIIFQEEDKGYAIGPDRPPTGYAKVETRNDKSKVTVYVQNLKPFESGECIYKCYLISHQNNKNNIAYLGIMNIDELGRGESSWETNSENAFETKTAIDKYNGAAIIVEREGIEDVVVPLAGYMSKEKFDLRTIIPNGRKAQQNKAKDKSELFDEAQEKVENMSDEAIKFEDYENSIKIIAPLNQTDNQVESDAKAYKTEQDTFEEEQKVIDKSKKSDELSENPKVEDMQIENERINIEEKRGSNSHSIEDIESLRLKYGEYDHMECINCYRSNLRISLRKMLEDILEDYEKVDKHKELKDCKLWKIDMEKYRRDGFKMTMYPCYDLIFYPLLYNPFYNYLGYIKRYGHYIFGMKHDKDGKITALIYGIPGKNIAFDQPFGGMTGFIKWVREKGDIGYWIMMYDPMTGVIVSER